MLDTQHRLDSASSASFTGSKFQAKSDAGVLDGTVQVPIWIYAAWSNGSAMSFSKVFPNGARNSELTTDQYEILTPITVTVARSHSRAH